MEHFIAAAKGGVTSIPADRWAATLQRFSQEHEGQHRANALCTKPSLISNASPCCTTSCSSLYAAPPNCLWRNTIAPCLLCCIARAGYLLLLCEKSGNRHMLRVLCISYDISKCRSVFLLVFRHLGLEPSLRGRQQDHHGACSAAAPPPHGWDEWKAPEPESWPGR